MLELSIYIESVSCNCGSVNNSLWTDSGNIRELNSDSMCVLIQSESPFLGLSLLPCDFILKEQKHLLHVREMSR